MIYKFEDTQTGKVYQVEGDDGTTREQAMEYLGTLDASALSQYEMRTTPVQQDTQTVVQSGFDSAGPSSLSDADAAAYLEMTKDPNVPGAEIGSWLAQRGGVWTPESERDLAEYRDALARGIPSNDTITYETAARNMLGPQSFMTDTGVGGFGAALEEGMALNPMGIVTRWLQDFTDAELQGGITKDTIRQQYPELDDAAVENIHDSLIGELRRREVENALFQADESGVNPVTRFAGNMIGGSSPLDIVPVGRGLTIGSQIAEGAVINALADAAVQGVDVAYGAQDEYRYDQTALAAAGGGAIQGGIAGTVRGGGALARRFGAGVDAPASVEAAPISVPKSRKNTKAYRQELVNTADEIIAYGQGITENWRNSPEFEVRDNFSALNDVDPDALAYYDTQSGRVSLNTENIVAEAQRLNTSVEEIVNASIFHESLGHYGLGQEFGEALDDTLARFIYEADTNVRNQIDNWLAKHPRAYEGAPNRDILALEEIMAEWSEKGPLQGTLYDYVANMIKDFGRRMGLDLNFSERELRGILAQAHGKVMRGEAQDVTGRGIRYMRPRNSEELGRVNPRDLSPDELFEAQNAYDVLDKMTENYEPTVMTLDELQAEAQMRGFTASDFLKRKAIEPGDISRRLMMYDIAMEKLDGKLTNLYAKIQDGSADYTTRSEYAKTLVRFQELSARIFGEQSEAGRALRTIQSLNYTKRRVDGLKNSLRDVDAHGLEEALNDPEFFNRFATEMQEQIKSTREATAEKNSYVANALNLPRAIMSSYDLSAPLRQGLFMIGRPEFWRGFPQMFKYAMSETSYRSTMNEIMQRDTYPMMVEAGVPFSRADGKLSQREEDFMTDWAQKIPVIGPGVKASERAYTGFLNKLRADTFDSIVANMERAGVDIASDPNALKALGGYIGNATGRGTLGRFTSAAPQLNSAFFSPRLIASRLNLLNPKYYYDLPAPVRKEALRDLLSFGAVATTMLGLAGMAGADVGLDPRSSDFGKIKVGNTRYDALGGFTQYLTFASRLVTGQRLNGIGEEVELGNEFGQQSELDTAVQFFRNKTSPIASFVLDFLDGQNAIGEEFTLEEGVKNRLVPMYVQDLLEVMEEYGPVEGAARAAPGVFGVGINTYVPYALNTEEVIDAPKSFTMSDLEDGENDQISVSNGTVTLKAETRAMWQERLNEIIQAWMSEETSNPEWDNLTDKEKAEIIKDVRSEARRVTKQEMLEELQLN